MKGWQAQAAEEERGRLVENMKRVCFTELLLGGAQCAARAGDSENPL